MWVRRLLILCAVLFCWPGSSQAAEPRIALIIGNSDYEGEALKNPANDARLIGDTLRKLDFDVKLVIDADQNTMKRAIVGFGDRLEKAGPEAVGLFYYAGHGVQVNGANYLIPLNTRIDREKDVDIEAVNAAWVLGQMEFAGNRMNIIILDACRNNPFMTRSFRSSVRGLARMDAPRGSLIAYSTSPGNVASDGEGVNSPYTAALARAMNLEGLAVERVFKETRRQVIDATGSAQTPWESSSLVGEFYFSGGSQPNRVAALPVESEADKVARAWRAVKDSKNADDFKAFLHTFGDSPFADLARDRVAELEGTKVAAVSRTPGVAPGERDFAAMLKSGGLIQNPKIPEEVYHNARIYELRGDYGNARRTYMTYLREDLDFVDPHLRFLTFLKVQEGRAGAREVYNYLNSETKSTLFDYALILLDSPPQRVERLKAFATDHPEFAHAQYELSKEYSVERKGSQTLSDKRNEKKYLETFQKLDDEGKFVRSFVDKEMVAAIREDAKVRLAALQALNTAAFQNPVKIKGSLSGSGWGIHITIFDKAEWIYYRVGTEGDYRNTGQREIPDQYTGRQLANTYFAAGNLDGPVPIFIKYTDLQGETHGPFEIRFNPFSAQIDGHKDILLRLTRNSWISFREWEGETLVYFSHLLTYRGALKE
ncbi:MAG: caspase family protein, partial [Magnetospiraceae bacterium]